MIAPILIVLIDALELGREGFRADITILGLFVTAVITLLGLRASDAGMIDKILRRK